jgi:hypothetical protein
MPYARLQTRHPHGVAHGWPRKRRTAHDQREVRKAVIIEPGRWYRMRKKSVNPTHWLYFEAPTRYEANKRAMHYFGYRTKREFEKIAAPVQVTQANISGWLFIEAAL